VTHVFRRAHLYGAVLAKIAVMAVFVVGIVAIAWCWTQPFGCAIGPVSDAVKLGLALSSDTVRQLLTLSTALAALGGAVVLGLKEGPKLNLTGRVLVLASTCCFVFSAYFALLWQSWLAEAYYLECPSLINQQVMRFPFIAHTYFFIVGLAMIGLIVLSATFGGPAQTERDNETSH
jgi:hypothetical protein